VYFYDVEIQTNIKQNLVKKNTRKNHKFSKKKVKNAALSTVHAEQWRATREEAKEGN
jgi:hypothetical protein